MKELEITALMARKKFKVIPTTDGFARMIEGQKIIITGSEILAQKSIHHLQLLVDYKIDSAYADSAIIDEPSPDE